MKRFKVGQQVVRARRGGYRDDVEVEFEPMTITKVGVRYCYAVRDTRPHRSFEEKFDIKSGRGTTYRSNEINRIVESREQFEQEERDLEKRQQFARAMNRWSMFGTEDVPVENIIKAAELLGIELDKQ